MKVDWPARRGVINYTYDPCPDSLGESMVAFDLGLAIHSSTQKRRLDYVKDCDLPYAAMQSLAATWQTIYKLSIQAVELDGRVVEESNARGDAMKGEMEAREILRVREEELALLQEENRKLRVEQDERDTELLNTHRELEVASKALSKKEELVASRRESTNSTL